MTICIIPARSGSKWIKNKNTKKLNNKPIISYFINTAIKSNLFSRVIVTTDSKKISNIAIKYGAEVPFLRNKKLSGDKIQDYPVVRECLIKSEKFFKIKFEYVILLRPTSPFREKKLIERGLKKLHHNKASSSVRSVIKTNCHPFRHWKITKKGKIRSIINNVKEPYNIPRQQLPELFFQSGDIEVIKRKTILNGSVSGNYVLPIIVKSYNDIDTIEDFKKTKNNG